MLGDIDSHDNICRALTNRTGHTVLSVDYRLAPEDPFPAGLDDCVQATKWAFENAATLGVDPTRLAVGGDSAGGNLAAVVCHLAPVPIRFQILVYPVTDARLGDTVDTSRTATAATASPPASMQWFVDQYISGGQGCVDDPQVSPRSWRATRRSRRAHRHS